MTKRLVNPVMISLILILLSCKGEAQKGPESIRPEQIRKPAAAGTFYPGNKEELSHMIAALLNRAETQSIQGNAIGIWAPHAGYVYSGQIAANAFGQVKDLKPDVIVLIGCSHTTWFEGASIGPWLAYETPLGDVPVDQPLVSAIRQSCDLIHSRTDVHLKEHSLEVQCPFIQTVFPGVPIVPIILGQTDAGEFNRIVFAVAKAVKNRKVLLVASSDMSHYPDYQDAIQADHMMIEAVSTFDPDALRRANAEVMNKRLPNQQCTLCGLDAVIAVMKISKALGANQTAILPYANSGDVSGDRSRVVGYGAAVFYQKGEDMHSGKNSLEDIPFTKEEIDQLFQVARESILSALKGERQPTWHIDSPHLNLKRGVFVTLTNKGMLRGCIGHFGQDLPIWQIAQQMAIAAATEDYRFAYNPVTIKEMVQIDIKISILSDLVKVDSYKDIEVGKHGVWVKMGGRSGTYLPEVATEQGWNRTQMLESLCAEKTGIPRDAYKGDAELYIYTSQILKEQ